jgi:hypothetical protein
MMNERGIHLKKRARPRVTDAVQGRAFLQKHTYTCRVPLKDAHSAVALHVSQTTHRPTGESEAQGRVLVTRALVKPHRCQVELRPAQPIQVLSFNQVHPGWR